MSEITRVYEVSDESVGNVILGLEDPRGMTEAEFLRNANILFHGASRHFDFSHEFDYRNAQYQHENDGSSTLGFGFYTTPSENEARNYSLVRQAREGVKALLVPILPYQARILDLRQKEDLKKNGPIPRELAQAWQKKFRTYFLVKAPRVGFLGQIIDGLEAEYLEYLSRVLTTDKIDLRLLLQTIPNAQFKSRNLPSPPWSYLFMEFMLEQGYDGLIYNEGGEGKNGEGGASYVFYNLEKIGTYQSWQDRR